MDCRGASKETKERRQLTNEYLRINCTAEVNHLGEYDQYSPIFVKKHWLVKMAVVEAPIEANIAFIITGS
jgi:hypothetical protein